MPDLSEALSVRSHPDRREGPSANTRRPTDRLQLFASGGFGTSGERIVAAQDFTRVPSRIIQGGAIFPISERFSGEVVGYYEDRSTLYVRRGVSFNLIWHW